MEIGVSMRNRTTRVAGFTLGLGLIWASVVAGPAFAEEEPGADDTDRVLVELEPLVVTEKVATAPQVVSPQPGEEARVVFGPGEELFWILEITNSDYRPDFAGGAEFLDQAALPTVGVFDSIDMRLQWTNEAFACFAEASCAPPAQTLDQQAFGDDFVRLPKIFNETTGVVAYHVEHAYQMGQSPEQWVYSQQTLKLAIPWVETPGGDIEVWVGYTYLFTEDMVGKKVSFTEEAMAITYSTVRIPLPPEDTGPAVTSGAEVSQEDAEGGSGWIAQLILGVVGIIVFFGFFALIISRMVALMRR
jgi:hypothetical protein